MKIQKTIILGMSFMAVLAINSCQKDTLKDGSSGETDRVYLPSADGADGIYSVLDSGKVVVDTANNTVNFPLPVYRGGFLKHETFVVDVTVDDAKVNALVQSGKLPANTVLLAADSYSLDPKDTVKSDNYIMKGTITPRIKLDKLSTYAGKTVALALKISNPTKYELNDSLTNTVVYFDVDKLSGDFLTIPITIVNPGFENGYEGWATIKGAAELKNASGRSGKDLNFWSSSVTSGSVLQTVNRLRNGKYTLTAWYKVAGIHMFIYANGVQQELHTTYDWTQISLDFTVTQNKAEFGFKGIDAGGNFSAWEPWCDMDDFSLELKL